MPERTPDDRKRDDPTPDYAHADEADGMVGTPNGGNVGETPRGWASFGASRHLPGGAADQHRKKR